MLDQLKSIAIFATVADELSFRAAAAKLSLSPSIVSVHIKRLEKQIGAPLFYRSTRHVTLTEDGKLFYHSAKAMMNIARDGLDKFADQASTNLTELRVAMPDVLAANPIIDVIAAFAKNHTGIRLNLISSDRQKNLIDEGYDVALRMGHFKDSNLKSKRIGEDRRVLVSAPSYIKRQSVPQHPEDLKTWNFVCFSLVPERIRLQRDGSETHEIWGNSVARASTTRTVTALCCAGLGVAALPYFQVETDLRQGRLELVLPEWSDPTLLPIYLVWPSNADFNVATREFINFVSRKPQ